MLRFAIPVAILALSVSPTRAQVRLKEGTYEWKTWNIEERSDHGIVSQATDRQLTRRFQTLVLENEYLVVTLLPGYGGRILSILYKPTGHEQLFQNPVGFADGIGAGNFYYNWLMVLGGIFPTFPEPEHGKTYLLPWKAEVLAQGPDRASVAMSITDNVDFPGKPGRFNLGVTGLACVATVTLAAGRAAVDLQLELRNGRSQSVRYEYWTCTSLAPGSTPGDTKAPGNSEMVVPIDRYSVGYGTGGIDRAAPGGGQEFRNLAWFRNWKQPGIAYAEPAVTKPWWGVVNHANGEGIFRLVDDPRATPGLKFWTWGYQNSYPLASPRRQFIELWAGHGHQFFSPVQLAAGATRRWSEAYAPTVGLSAVTAASQGALAHLRADKGAYDAARDAAFTATADLVSLTPGAPLRVSLAARGRALHSLLDTVIQPSAAKATRLVVTRPLALIGGGGFTLELRLRPAQGGADLLRDSSVFFSVTGLPSAAKPARPEAAEFSLRPLPGNRVEVGRMEATPWSVEILSFDGRRQAGKGLPGAGSLRFELPSGGIHWARVTHDGRVGWRRFLLR